MCALCATMKRNQQEETTNENKNAERDKKITTCMEMRSWVMMRIDAGEYVGTTVDKSYLGQCLFKNLLNKCVLVIF